MTIPSLSEDKSFTFNGFTYTAQLWGDAGDEPVIALHGWLDNSGSFSVLAPQLSGMQCLALDLAGHGLSDKYPGFVDYPVWSEISAIYAIADEMGWDTFTLLGHSRGAMMSLLAAGIYPQRIKRIILLDALTPPVIEAALAPSRMTDNIKETRFRLRRELSLYDSYEDAISARCRSRHADIERKSAEILAVRGVTEIDGRYHWHADGKLLSPSSVALSPEMIDAFIDKVTQANIPILLLLGELGCIREQFGESGFNVQSEKLIERLQINVEKFPDGHYLHMESSAPYVAKAIQTFVKE